MSELTVALPAEIVEAIALRVAEILAPRFEALPASPYLSIGEAAEHARCSKQRIYDLRSAGVLTKCGDGSRALVLRAELEAYLAGRSHPVATSGAKPVPLWAAAPSR